MLSIAVQVSLENIWSSLEVLLILPGTFNKWIPLPEYQVLLGRATFVIPDEVFNLILQMILH